MAATITTPDQMAECHREQVVEEKSGPRQLGESLQGLAHPFEDVRMAAQEQGKRDEIPVGDRGLEAGRDKGRHRGMIASIVSVVVRVLKHNQPARHTQAWPKTPRTNAERKPSLTLATAIFTAVTPTS